MLKKLSALAIASTCYLFFTIPVFAEQINSFNTTLSPLSNGQINVQETITYDFGNNEKHGIYRYIPLLSNVGNLYRLLNFNVLSVERDGAPEDYSLSESNYTENIKIGSPDKTITGVHTYTIDYTVSNEIVHFNDHDEINWNVTGNGWEVPIVSASATIKTDSTITQQTCFTGAEGSTEKSCQVSNTNSLTMVTTQQLEPNEGFTIVAAFPPNTYPPAQLTTQKPAEPGSIDQIIQSIKSLPMPLLLILSLIPIFYYLVLPIYLYAYYRTHHHKARLGPVTVNFDIPEDPQGNRLPPPEAGATDNARVGKEDIIATIYDFAVRKLLVIKQSKSEKKLLGLIPGSTSYNLEKIADLPAGSTDYETNLFTFLFSSGNTADITALSSNFYLTFQQFSNQVFQNLKTRGIYSADPRSRQALFIILGVLSLLTLNILLTLLLFYFSIVLNGRTVAGQEVDWKIDGLKLYLKGMGREFSWQAHELILVEKMIPYAIAFGYIDKLMEQIKIHYPNYQPTWYVGNQPLYLAYGSMFNTFSQSIVTTAPSSSSGFSGGGFSGGGGGGGGGGSW